MNQVQNESSSTNTVLIVLVLVAVVGFGVWFFGQGAVPSADTGRDLNVDVTLPTTGGGQQNGGTPAPAPATPVTPAQ